MDILKGRKSGAGFYLGCGISGKKQGNKVVFNDVEIPIDDAVKMRDGFRDLFTTLIEKSKDASDFLKKVEKIKKSI